MITLHELRRERIGSTKPIARVIEKVDHLNILGLAISKDIMLKEHKTDLVSRLIVLEGVVEYIEGDTSVVLHSFDEYDIPLHKVHALRAIEDCLCLLIQKK